MLLGPSFTLVLMLGMFWAFMYWVGWRFLNVDLGLHSTAAPWILAAGTLTIVAISGPEVLKTLRNSKERVRAIEADLASGMVEELALRIVEAIRLQEPEHGGFLFFLRTTDERVYVQYDYESQNLSVDDQDPEESSYLPRETLSVTRTRNEGRVLASYFNGQPVPIVQKGTLSMKPKRWPEPDTFCSTPWTGLMSEYAT